MKKLSEYAREHGVTYRTAYNHWSKGLITGAYQLPSSTIVIPDNAVQAKNKSEYVVTYARVSSSENKDNLETQSQRLYQFCIAKGWAINESVKEIGSGVNDNRKKLNSILEKKVVTKLVVEHKDRLTRFGFNYLKKFFEGYGCEVVVINEAESEKADIVQDFVSIITSFCAKLYGQRRSKRKTEKLIEDLNKL